MSSSFLRPHCAHDRPQSVRVGGKPTERFLAYLSGIVERDIANLGAQCGFWERVNRKRIGEYYKERCHVRRDCGLAIGFAFHFDSDSLDRGVPNASVGRDLLSARGFPELALSPRRTARWS